MSLTSISFLFIYFPLLLGLYYLPNKWIKNNRKIILLLASWGFYAMAEPFYICLLVCSTLLNYYIGKTIIFKAKYKYLGNIAIIIDVAILLFFKYINSIVTGLGLLGMDTDNSLLILMPIGLSYYTFHEISYIVDCMNGEVHENNDFIEVAFYIANFARIMSGPISQYRFDYINCGECVDWNRNIKLIIIGIAKKIIIADSLSPLVNACFLEKNNSAIIAWYGAIAYSLQLYFDFSGYSQVVQGVGGCFGMKIEDNFNYPYYSKSISEFWRRWHISLTKWFTKYIYISLGGSRVSYLKHVRNLFIVWLCTGIWHGSNVTFIVWAMIYFIIQLIEKKTRLLELINKLHIGHIYCLFVVIICWVIFKSNSLLEAIKYIGTMFGSNGLWHTNDMTVISNYIISFMLGIVFSIPICSKEILQLENRYLKVMKNVLLAVMLILSFMIMISKGYSVPLYANF